MSNDDSYFELRADFIDALSAQELKIIRDTLMTNKDSVRAKLYAIISDPTNDNYIDNTAVQEMFLNDSYSFDLSFEAFYIDNNYYNVFPDKKKCKNLSIDLSFVCLPDYVLKNIKKLLSEYKISVDKVFSHSYLKGFSSDKSKNIYEIAQKVMFGLNENEVSITNQNPKNKGFFERFFEFFK